MQIENPLYILANKVSDFAFANTWSLWPSQSENFPDKRIKPRFIFHKNLLISWWRVFCRKTFLDSTCFRLKQRNGSHRTLRNLKWTWHQIFSYRVINLRSVRILLLAPANTMVKPTEHEFAHRTSPIQEGASQCSQTNCNSKLCSVCGRVMVWQMNPRVLQTPCLRQDAWAHILWKLRVRPDSQHSHVVYLRKIQSRRKRN